MIGIYQLADLTIQVEGSIEELVACQGVAREFDRACRKIRKAAGEDGVQILLDKDLESREGRKFSKIRLRAYAHGKNYTIDCGSTEDNILGVYVPWDAAVEVYDREAETVEEVYPLGEGTPQKEKTSQEVDSAPRSPGADGEGSPPPLDPNDPPTPSTTGDGQVTKDAAVALWNAAKRSKHTRDSFQSMLASVAGITNPRLLQEEDWAKAWEYAVDPATWKLDEEIEEEQELPLE